MSLVEWDFGEVDSPSMLVLKSNSLFSVTFVVLRALRVIGFRALHRYIAW